MSQTLSHRVGENRLEAESFPRAGARARRLKRFERDYRAWLDSPEGRFAAWCAARSQTADAAPSAERPGTR